MRSAIVPIDERGYAHFVVVRGGSDGAIDVADPAFGNRTMSVERFARAWKDGIGFALSRKKQ